MKISLLTDAPKHNLALMKISAFHKTQGDSVYLNMPIMPVDKTYASWLYEKSDKYNADIEGGPGIDPSIKLPDEIEKMKPDYNLFPIDYSLGYTWRLCTRKCEFCKVKDSWADNKHHSIWEFHDKQFDKICLLNNNTFMDPQWRETFQEIWDADLTVHDENGYDLRLLNDEKARALKKTKFEDYIHFAWDRMRDEKKILEGLKIAKKHKLKTLIYVLMGYDTTFEEDVYRCQKINDCGSDPFPMLYKESKGLRKFRRMIYTRMYRKYKTIMDAWKNYKHCG